MHFIAAKTAQIACDKAQSLGWKRIGKLRFLTKEGCEVHVVWSALSFKNTKRPTVYVTECFKQRSDYKSICSVMGRLKTFIRYV